MLDENIKLEEVEKVCEKLIIRKFPGMDKITNFMVRNGGSEIAKYIHYLYSLTYDKNKYPINWNYCKVIPIPKNNKKNPKI